MRLLLIISLALSIGLVACSGDTDPATNVTNVSATLNAHGHSTGTGVKWWWEYSTVKADLGTANDTEKCGNIPDHRCGPAQTADSNDVHLSQPITGLTPSTTYYFRICGQDQGGSPLCGQIRSFKTLAGTQYTYDRQWGGFNLPYGLTADTDAITSKHYVYVADTGNNQIAKFTPTGELVTRWGSGGSGFGEMSVPAGIAVLRTVVTVAERGNNRIQDFARNGDPLLLWGSEGSGNRQFDQPFGVAVDSNFSIYVADSGNDRVQKFTEGTEFVTAWGGHGTGDGQFDRPFGVAAGPGGDIYVSDLNNDRIQRFSNTGTFLGKWGSHGSAPGQFDQPSGVATDSTGAVYVADQFNQRVQKFTSTGGYVAAFGGSGTGPGQFRYPVGVAVDDLGSVYVTDLLNNRVEKFLPTQ